MEAGRELDALVAEKVMGFVRIPGHISINSFEIGPGLIHWKRPNGNPVIDLPQYSIDIAAAWEIVEKIVAIEGMEFNLEYDPDRSKIGTSWMVNLGVYLPNAKGYKALVEETALEEGSMNPAHAICLAALRVVGFIEKRSES